MVLDIAFYIDFHKNLKRKAFKRLMFPLIMLPVDFKEAPIKKKNPLVSVIIPAYNEEEDIGKCLDSVINHNYRPLEIIVVDDGSTDKTKKIVCDYKKNAKMRLILLKQNHKGAGEAKNLGAKNARGEMLLFIDADITLCPDYVEKMIRPVIEGKALGTEGAIELHLVENKIQECWGKQSDFGKLSGFHSPVFRAIKRKTFIDLGGFDRKYGYSDDKTFFYKYGTKFLLVKEAKCFHKTPKTLKEVFKQSRWIGSSSLSSWLEIPVINITAVFGLYLLSPAAILILSAKKCKKSKNFGLFFPKMIEFMAARYFGNLAGYLRKIFLKKNMR